MSRHIRNFSIIAHIDHGKSTLASALLNLCENKLNQTADANAFDKMDLEREKGITIKAKTNRLEFKYDGLTYILNLIDTPGHVDFKYEVSKALSAVENSILLIDATKGVESQSIANLNKALENNHKIIPVLNKIDSHLARIEETIEQICELGFEKDEILQISAKNNLGVRELLETLIRNGRAPVINDDSSELQALIIDSWYDNFNGVVVLVRVFKGTLTKNKNLKTYHGNKNFNITSLHFFTPNKENVTVIESGEIGAIVTTIKNPLDVRVGDTIILQKSDTQPIAGFQEPKSLVFCMMYPEESSLAAKTQLALEKYRLNDPAFFFEVKTSAVYGIGFSCGFLGVLHMEIVQERIAREFNITLLCTLPTVVYHLKTKTHNLLEVHNAYDWPPIDSIIEMQEPYASCSITIMRASNYLGKVTQLIMSKRSKCLRKINGKEQEISDGFEIKYLQNDRILIECLMPLGEIVVDFYSRLKSDSSGFADFDYQVSNYLPSDLCKLIVLINDNPIDELSYITHVEKARGMAGSFVKKLKEIIPSFQIPIKIQIAMSSIKKIIAREDIAAYRKNVTAHCSGGDINRKKKLLNNQAAGKDKLYEASSGNVSNTIRKIVMSQIHKIFDID